MSDNHDLLNDKDVCSFEEHEAENVCSNKDAVAPRHSNIFLLVCIIDLIIASFYILIAKNRIY